MNPAQDRHLHNRGAVGILIGVLVSILIRILVSVPVGISALIRVAVALIRVAVLGVAVLRIAVLYFTKPFFVRFIGYYRGVASESAHAEDVASIPACVGLMVKSPFTVGQFLQTLPVQYPYETFAVRIDQSLFDHPGQDS
jgi:hypothetical protein